MQSLLQSNFSSSQNQYTFDTYLNNKLKYGPAQTKLSRSLLFLIFSQGSQSIALGLLLPILVQQWSLTIFQRSLILTFVYLGVILGSALQGISDTYGRYNIITVAGILQAIAGLLSVISPNYTFFLIIRFIYGIGIGIVLPLSVTYLAQITPNINRVTIISISKMYWSFGVVATCLLAYILLKQNNWRLLLFLICLPGIYSLYLHYHQGRESPRYLFLNGKYLEARKIIQQMENNNLSQKITQKQFNQIIGWSKKAKQNIQSHDSYLKLFDIQIKMTTIKLTLAWFSVCFIFYGIMLLLPLILSHPKTKNTTYLVMLLIGIFQIIPAYIAKYILDHPRFGRKNTILISFGISTVFSFILLLDVSSAFLFSFIFIVIKFFITLGFLTLYSYTAELYHTLVRGKAMGFTSFMGRLSTVLIGFVGVYALQAMGGNGLYFLFFVLSLISFISIYLIPNDTLGRDLDTI